MEETLGKRIAASRKRLGLTQDALAEQLGVTAQAVSKWENDQSCPDITMLPKLAQVFRITTDELLGLKANTVHTAEVITTPTASPDNEPEGIHVQKAGLEFQWDGGRRSMMGFAVWILLSGFLLFLTGEAEINTSLSDILWTSGLMLYGLFGIVYPHFSLFRLGCAFLGGYYLCVEVLGQALDRNFILPVFLMCFGFSLLVKALKKPKHSRTRIVHNGKPLGKSSSHCTYDGESFNCATSFGDNQHLITLPRLSGGSAQVSFGDLEVDLRGCEEFAPECTVKLNCSFGELCLLVPERVRIEPNISTSFAALEAQGSPAPEAASVIYVNGSAHFGQITLRYV